MKRKIYDKLLEWKNHRAGRTALLIEGARRVGKSYIVKEFAEKEYESHILIDFNNVEPEVLRIFEDFATNLEQLFQMLQLHYGVKLIPGRSLLVFDEIQMRPKVRALIKYLVADGRYHYIETGSLISIRRNVKDIMIPSEEEKLPMYPMDFEEFLTAMGNESLYDYIRSCYQRATPLGPIHRKAMDLFRLYMTIGGMPQVVNTYLATHSFAEVEKEKQLILTLYRNDIHKYATGAEYKAAAIFEAIPSQLQLHESRFLLSDLDKEARYAYYESAFFWMQDSGIANICYNSFAPNIGLGMNTDRTMLKCYLGDTGLLVSLAFSEKGEMSTEVYERLLHGKLETNLGMIMENMVAQSLRASGHRLFFYSKSDRTNADNQMEIDFLITKSVVSSRKNLIALEVKSGSRYSTVSLEKCLKKFSEQVGEGIVLHTSDVENKNGFRYLPLYMASLL